MSSIQELVDGFPFMAVMAVTDAATNGVNASFTPMVPVKGTIVAVQFIPSTNIVANATNFRTLTVRNKGTSGVPGGTTAVASRSWAATNSTLAVPELFALSATPANLEVQAGDVFDLNQVATAAGLIIPVSAFTIYVRPHR
jgi:hypothetical protein